MVIGRLAHDKDFDLEPAELLFDELGLSRELLFPPLGIHSGVIFQP